MSKTRSSIKWSAIERILTQGVQFLILLLLARILSPESFGLIGMMSFFLAIAQTFIDSGFSAALIRKGNPTESEYSTAFYFNIVIGIVVYCILYFLAPLIATFYGNDELTHLMRVLALIIPVNSFSIVYRTKLIVDLNFRAQAIVSLFSVLVSGGIAVYLALSDYGVWALVYQSIIFSIMSLLLFVIVTQWRPSWEFSFDEFTDMFSFGWRLLLSGLLEVTYSNSFVMIIGKFYSSYQLGLYFQANRLIELPTKTFVSIISRVNFPVMSKINNDEGIINVFLSSIKNSCFVFFPLTGILAVLAKPIIFYLIGDKWLLSSAYLSILCFSFMLYPIHSFNLNILQVKKRSDLFLRLEIIKKVIGVVILSISFRFGVVGMCYGIVIASYLSLFVNCYYTEKVVGLKVTSQIKCMIPTYISNLLSLGVIYILITYFDSDFMSIIIGAPMYIIIYLLILTFWDKKDLFETINALKGRS